MRLHGILFALGLIISAASIAEVTAASAATPGDATRGKLVFLECQGCHAVTTGGASLVGPNLQGVYGRLAGSLPGYDYSAALKSSGITWTSDKLNSWLADPSALVPGNNMAFAGIASPDLRADVIAYLETLK